MVIIQDNVPLNPILAFANSFAPVQYFLRRAMEQLCLLEQADQKPGKSTFNTNKGEYFWNTFEKGIIHSVSCIS